MSPQDLLLSEISSGKIRSKQELLARAEGLGLQITRNGANYIGCKPPEGKRFRIHFHFGEAKNTSAHIPTKQQKHLSTQWVYALTAYSHDGNQKACYIGKTRHPLQRLLHHQRGHQPNRSSFEFFQWAHTHHATAFATILTKVVSTEEFALSTEAYWLHLALKAGFHAPAHKRWAPNLRKPITPHGLPKHWDFIQILRASIPLDEIAQNQNTPAPLHTINQSISTCALMQA